MFTKGSKNDYQKMKAKLAKRFRTEPSIGDIIWGLMNESLLDCDKFECRDVKDLMKEFRVFEKQLKKTGKPNNSTVVETEKKSESPRVIDTKQAYQPYCNLCGGLMINKTVSSGNVSGLASALIVLTIGLLLTFGGAFCGGFLIGIPLCILALFMGGKRKKILRCEKCGHTVNRT